MAIPTWPFADAAGYQEGQMWMHLGGLITGVGLAGVGIVLLVQKPKPGQKRAPSMEKLAKVIGLIILLLGLAIPIYVFMTT